MNLTGRSSHRFQLASALLFASATVAAAQTAPQPPTPAPGWTHHGVKRHGPQDWQAEHAKMEEQRLAELHTKLDLKPAQEAGWRTFVIGLQAARPTREPHDKSDWGKADWEKKKSETTPERLDHQLARIDEMRAHLAQLDQVVKSFYASLSKDQQTIFDDNFKILEPHQGGPGGWAHHGEGHGPMEHGPEDHGWSGPPPMGPLDGPGAPGGPPPQS